MPTKMNITVNNVHNYFLQYYHKRIIIFFRPVRHLPGTKKPTVAIRCSPICYELIDDRENGLQENNEHFK